MKNFTTQEEKLFDELWITPNDFTPNEKEPIYDLDKRSGEIKSFIHSSHLRLIDYLLEKWPKKKTEWDKAWEFEDCLLSDYGEKQAFNSALQQTRKLLEDYKKEL